MRRGNAHDFLNGPHMIADTSFYQQVSPAASDESAQTCTTCHRDVFVQFLAECVRQTSKAPVRHPQVQILPFDVTCRDVIGIGWE